MVCRGCGKESPDGFSFCPHCGMALVGGSPVAESPSPPLGIRPFVEVATEEAVMPHNIADDRADDIGTYLLGAFSLISLLVSIVKGVVPIYLVESAIWAGAAWYWHRKKPHSDLANGVVIVCAALFVIGEAIQIASQTNSSLLPKPPTPIADSSGMMPAKPNPEPPPCPSGIPSGANISEIAPDQVEGSDGELWYVEPDSETGARGKWYFHFTVINHAKAFCLTAVEYDVDLESDSGAILKGHGKKHIEPLSPEWKYTPHAADLGDIVTFGARWSSGALNTWKITKAYGFPQTATATN